MYETTESLLQQRWTRCIEHVLFVCIFTNGWIDVYFAWLLKHVKCVLFLTHCINWSEGRYALS